MTTATAHHEAHSEKQHAALSSLFWALFLTLIKLGAGLATNSLGILSEALHSSLDLVAAGITFFAVRVAARPADETHPYGYGKIENLSALAETVLLLVTCGWIVHEAVNRLFFDAPEITPSWWGVGIILVQYAFCRIWLRRHSHGPVEWLWKKLTWLDIPFLDRKIAS